MKDIIEHELYIFNKNLQNELEGKIDKYLFDFVTGKSKRLRPLLGILFVKSLGSELNTNHNNLFIASELIHNASLIHDDVIDNAKIRRGNKTINTEFDNALSVSSGDILLSLGMQKVLNIENKEVQNMIAENMFLTCQGEIYQYFSKYKNISIEEYIEKSRKKTSLLFEISILGGVMLCNKTEYYEKAKGFAKNFGIAFQIKNDLKNYIETKDDYNQGVYTAPVIFGEKDGIEKTISLINNYLDLSSNTIKTLIDNVYKDEILKIIDSMRVV